MNIRFFFTNCAINLLLDLVNYLFAVTDEKALITVVTWCSKDNKTLLEKLKSGLRKVSTETNTHLKMKSVLLIFQLIQVSKESIDSLFYQFRKGQAEAYIQGNIFQT